jgi:hypothetical protein
MIRMQANQATVFDDRRMRHNVINIVASPASSGYRDPWLLVSNPWDMRRYGEAYETSVLARIDG